MLPRLSPRLLAAFVAPLSLFGVSATAERTSASQAAAGESPVDFAKDIQPIFEEHCVECHGAEKQKSGWRVDLKQDALNGGDNFAPNIIPGKSAESPLIHFVTGLDPDMLMPSKGERLTQEEVSRLRKWIDQGAIWPEMAKAADPLDWWSFKPLVRPAVPAGGAEPNPIDSFIRQKLAEKGLTPSEEADRRVLIRRLTYDLTGLPSSPEEVEAFVADPDPHAYEKLVDRLLASPRYGERWARHWLDVARYGETHGYDKDKQRLNAWPYRDYVIRAFNEDKPYGRFVQEQIAGDVLFPHTRDGIEALGFISAGPWDLIGHMELPEAKTDGKIARNLDRDDMVANAMNAFTSLTVQCARCHNHKAEKFITQEHYYGLQAVFAALDRADREYDTDSDVSRRRQALKDRQRDLTTRRDTILNEVKVSAGAALTELDQQIEAARKAVGGKETRPVAHGYHSQIASTQEKVKWVQVDLGNEVSLSSVVLRACDDDFNDIGPGFGFPVRFKVELSSDAEFRNGVTMVGEYTNEDFANPRLQPVEIQANGAAGRYLRITATKLAQRMDDFIFALAEVAVIDIQGKNLAKEANVAAFDTIEAPPRWKMTNLVDGVFPETSLSGTQSDIAQLTTQREALIASVLTAQARDTLAHSESELTVVKQELAKLPKPHTVYAGTIHHGTGDFRGTGPDGGKPRPIHVLHRGEVNSPRQEAKPGAVPIISEAPATFQVPADAPEGERRAALARWLTDEKNPLTWRSIVNRVWQYHFGRGLVDSPNDFGHMGQMPTHPELLDWLAAEFRDGGQSFKKLHRLIVTSATYRQRSDSGHAQSADSDNRYLWRMNRRRLEAEGVRDSVLAAAGKLDLTMGGPSFQDFAIEQPEHSPHYKYRLHDPDDPKTHRRSVYRMIVRSQPQPFLTTLDCADPSMSVEKRNESISALQALALMNNQLIVAMAKHFATRLKAEEAGTEAQVRRGFHLAIGRAPDTAELERLTAYAEQHGLANACRLLFNLNEFVFVD